MPQPAIRDLFALAEGPELLVRVSLCNNLGQALYELMQNPRVQDGIQVAAADMGEAQQVLDRLARLIDHGQDAAHRHPYDVAMAAYLFVLSRSNARGLAKAMELLSQYDRPNLFWTWAMYRYLLDQAAGGEASTSEVDVPSPSAARLGEAAQWQGLTVSSASGSWNVVH